MPDPQVLLTRSAEDNEGLGRMLRERGIESRSLPMIAIADRPFDASVAAPFHRWRKGLAGAVHILLTSRHATDRWFRRRAELAPIPRVASYLVVGRRSAQLIGEHDPERPITTVADSVEELQEEIGLLSPSLTTTDILYPCSRLRRDQSVEGFRALRFDLCELPLYEPILPPDSADHLPQALATLASPSAILFFSPSAVTNMIAALAQHRRGPDHLTGHHLITIGPTTAEALHAHGLPATHSPRTPVATEVVALVERLLGGRLGG